MKKKKSLSQLALERALDDMTTNAAEVYGMINGEMIGAMSRFKKASSTNSDFDYHAAIKSVLVAGNLCVALKKALDTTAALMERLHQERKNAP